MKIKRAPIAAASTVILFAGLLPAFCQGLPNTNMGRFVHTPGDNQYEAASQAGRHAPPPAPPQAQVQYSNQGPPPWTPTPPPRMPDPSIEPIAADEPVAPAGFPPLPDRFDLGVKIGWAAGAGGGSHGGGGNGGGNEGGGNHGGPPQMTGMHQHYGHYEPGAFGDSSSHGYYKARTPEAPINPSAQPQGGGGGGGAPGDVYQSGNGGGGTHKGANSANMNYGRGGGGSGNPFAGLGREPKLNDKESTAMTPDAPQAVIINQATTQDLSIPEDEFQYQKPVDPNNTGNRFAKRLGKALLRPVNSVGAYAGIRF